MRLARVVALLGAALVLSACQALGNISGGNNAATGAQGRIVWPKDGDLWIYDLSTKQQKKITNLPGGSAITGASWSPDGKRLVYSQFWRRPNDRASGADLFISDADGSNPQVFVERDAPNSVVEAPEWSNSGRVYFDIRHVQNGRESLQVARQAEGGQPEVLVDGGYNPAISPDESTLIYLVTTRAGQAMMKKTLDQPGDGCELMNDQVFQYLSQPRISPDGTKVALGGSGEPNQQPSGCAGAAGGAVGPAAAPPNLNMTTMLGPGAALAHGLPADVYTLNLDGSGLQRVADIKDDDPTVAWSPDGSKMAIFGVAALYMVDSKGGPTTKLVEQGGYGGLDWAN
jgi:Tol biopolymer transport system component